MKNNKKFVIGGVVAAALVLIGVGVYALVSMQEKPASQQSFADAEQNAKKDQPNSEVRVSSLDEFFSDGSTRQCSFSSSNESTKFDVQYYFDNNRSFGTVSTSPAEGVKTTELNKPATINQLYKDGVSYTWEATSDSGVKFSQSIEDLKKAAKQSLDAAGQAQKDKAEQTAKDTVVTCKPWSADEAKFTVPSDVRFREVKI